MYSIFISREEGKSSIQFGDYNTNLIEKDPDDDDDAALKWLNTSNGTDWQVDLFATKIGANNLYKDSYRQALFDVGV